MSALSLIAITFNSLHCIREGVVRVRKVLKDDRFQFFALYSEWVDYMYSNYGDQLSILCIVFGNRRLRCALRMLRELSILCIVFLHWVGDEARHVLPHFQFFALYSPSSNT